MNDEIKEAIKTYAQDLTISMRDVPNKLQSRFDGDLLFDTISKLIEVPSSLERREWIACIETLCQLDKQKANMVLDKALETDDEDKRFRVIKVLGTYGTDYVVPTLLKMLKDELHPSIRYRIAYTLGLIGDKAAIPDLQWAAENDQTLNYEDVPVSYAAKEALKMLGSQESE
jgi:HEAT repeat protein